MWFAPPQDLPTRVLTRMPDRHRRAQRTEWADANRPGQPADCFLEGPCFDAAGRLHVVDIPYGRIFRIEGDSWHLLAEYDGWPNGLKIGSSTFQVERVTSSNSLIGAPIR